MYDSEKTSPVRKIVSVALSVLAIGLLVWLVLWSVLWRGDSPKTDNSPLKSPQTTQNTSSSNSQKKQSQTTQSSSTNTAASQQAATELVNTGSGDVWIPILSAVIIGTAYAHIKSSRLKSNPAVQ